MSISCVYTVVVMDIRHFTLLMYLVNVQLFGLLVEMNVYNLGNAITCWCCTYVFFLTNFKKRRRSSIRLFFFLFLCLLLHISGIYRPICKFFLAPIQKSWVPDWSHRNLVIVRSSMWKIFQGTPRKSTE